MTSENVINIDDARELRQMGLPILPVIDAEFSKAALRLLDKADIAKIDFYKAFVDYSRKGATENRFNRMQRALARIKACSVKASEFISNERSETVALQVVLAEPAEAFVEFWSETLAGVEGGEETTIRLTSEMMDSWDTPTDV